MKIKINWGVGFNTNNYERIVELDIVDDIDEWFYDNISELTSCDDEFIIDRNNVYFSDYVRYTILSNTDIPF